MAVGRNVPGPGVMGVLVGGRVAVGVTMLAGMINKSPTLMAFGSVISFSAMMSSIVLLYKAAMPPSESPAWTTYSTLVPFARSGGMGVEVGNGMPGLGSNIT